MKYLHDQRTQRKVCLFILVSNTGRTQGREFVPELCGNLSQQLHHPSHHSRILTPRAMLCTLRHLPCIIISSSNCKQKGILHLPIENHRKQETVLTISFTPFAIDTLEPPTCYHRTICQQTSRYHLQWRIVCMGQQQRWLARAKQRPRHHRQRWIACVVAWPRR